ncbi:prepilin-type N-terminal cleavage/methylation domain-containing protein [Sulfurimonas sp.]|nr:prepilin-type N-terminal cleavage/methylation domain-containing protein [Sulfurimonas sp.]
MRRVGFTMMELIFVIVIMGILSKFGLEFLSQAYNNFIFSQINNSLQSRSTAAVEGIASRLQFRIKDSIIARDGISPIAVPAFEALSGSTLGDDANILEWVGTDIEGLRGDLDPLWSGIIDLENSSTNFLDSPETNTTALNTLIGILSSGGAGTSGINDSAIYFIGSDSNIQTGYGWETTGTGMINQSSTMHPIRRSLTPGQENLLIPVNGDTGGDNNFTGEDVYEYYQLAWTAYAVVHSTDGNLTLHYDYQPWAGETYADGDSQLLMEDVDTFRFKAVGSVVKIQVCVSTDIIDGNEDGEGYSLCKEKTIY